MYGARMEGPSNPAVDDGVDLSLLHWMLSLTVEERLDALQGFVDSVVELNGGTLPATL